MTLSGNELSITNHDVRGFSNTFQNQKLKKVCNLIGQIHFRLQFVNQVL